MSKEDINLNENGSMSKRRLDRNSINAPGMIDYDKLKAALTSKPRADETIWGFVNNQQNKKKQAQVSPAPATPTPLPPNPVAQQAINQTVQAQYPKTMQLLMLLQDTGFKEEVKAATMQAQMTGRPNPTILTIKGMLHSMGLA